MRWDLIRPWSEKYNYIQTVVPGEQSVLYPNALPGLVVPGDPGIPSTLSPSQYQQFRAPNRHRILAEAKHGGSRLCLATRGRAAFAPVSGIFYTAFPGLSAGIMYGVPPFGYNYLSPAPPLFATPFTNAGDGTQNTDPYPFVFPPHNVATSQPYTQFNFAN